MQLEVFKTECGTGESSAKKCGRFDVEVGESLKHLIPQKVLQ